MMDRQSRYQSFAGLDVIVTPDLPRMQLPDELLPGRVPWPPGFKADMDRWLLSFFGTTNVLKDGDCIASELFGDHVLMNPRTYARLRNARK